MNLQRKLMRGGEHWYHVPLNATSPHSQHSQNTSEFSTKRSFSTFSMNASTFYQNEDANILYAFPIPCDNLNSLTEVSDQKSQIKISTLTKYSGFTWRNNFFLYGKIKKHYLNDTRVIAIAVMFTCQASPEYPTPNCSPQIEQRYIQVS